MHILHYNDLDTLHIPNYKKICQALADDNFRTAQVKKIGDNLYRAKLNASDRLLFSLYRYRNQSYALMLEWIKNHAYENSRFLHRGVTVDEDKLEDLLTAPTPDTLDKELAYLNPQSQSFAWLGKVISFDDVQQAIYQSEPPLVIIGSAGSGKTALLLEKMKQVAGNVLYVSLSPYLVKNAYDLYHSQGYENTAQDVEFLSYQELLETIRIPEGKAIDFIQFKQWFNGHAHSHKIKDAHKLFEEFRGVLTSNELQQGYLSKADYLDLGVKQSIFLQDEREAVYGLFEKYLSFLKDQPYYDINLISQQWLQYAKPTYDFVVIDEVQDFTSIQLYLILKLLNQSGQFLMCGDSNQIVHPNFFSWDKIKTLFYHQTELQGGQELVRILHTNYRNAPEITDIANRILLLKNARFGSIDKESHYLVKSNGHLQGNAILLHDTPKLLQELNDKTKQSTQFAVIVMHDAQKQEVGQFFNTPLVFSIQEAKGLEYSNIILYNFISSESERFRTISQDVSPEQLQAEELTYRRNKDKTDKSLEVYKFYINALYVALTRSIKNVYWVEHQHEHPLLTLLQLPKATESLDMVETVKSSIEEWQLEAQKLALQGKQEQAERIQTELLKQKVADWTVYKDEAFATLLDEGLKQQQKKSLITLLEYAQVYDSQELYQTLLHRNSIKAKTPHANRKLLLDKYYFLYTSKNLNNIEKRIDDYGIEFRDSFNRTPLMNAVWTGNVELTKRLIARGADVNAIDNQQHTSLQIALAQAIVTPYDTLEHPSFMENKHKYAKNFLVNVYDAISPSHLALKIDQHLIKIDQYLMEYFILNLVLVINNCLKKQVKGVGKLPRPVFTAGDILSAIEQLPTGILPSYRTKRAYISSILSKNEIDKDDKYNRKLFIRVAHGSYIINPDIEIKYDEQWYPIYPEQLLTLLEQNK